ncbi:MAG: hypothetical protein WAZ18_07265 [Alphaproteobacteria bacterium]
MDVRALRDRVVELSQHGIGNDVDVNAKVLAWLNSAYHEVMDEMIPLAPAALQVREDVVVGADGAGVLASPVQKIVQAVERGSKRVLKVVSPVEVLDAEVGGVRGSPVMCSVSGGMIQVYPVQACTVSVVYVPRVVDLVEGGSEASVLLPPSLHAVLVWGALVWSSVFDRGFMSASELMVYNRQWAAGKEQVRLSVLGSSAPVRVKAFNWV